MLIKRRSLLAASGAAALAAPSVLSPASAQSKQIFLAGASYDMRDAILHTRYELQYVLYLFALHRLLKARLPDYDYDRHVGGAVYLFLRGIEAPSQGLHAERPPRALIEALDERFAHTCAEEPA